MPVFIWLEFEPSLITDCACDCDGLCVDCKDETKIILSVHRGFRKNAAEVIRLIRVVYGCKDPIRLYVQGYLVPEHTDITFLENQFVNVKRSKIRPLNNGHGVEAAAPDGEDSDKYLEDPNWSPSHDFLGAVDSGSDDSGMSSEESDEQDYDDAILDTGSDESLSQRKVDKEESVHSSVLSEPSETSDGRGDRQSLKRPLNSDEEDEDSGSTQVKMPKLVRHQRGSIPSTIGLSTRVSGLRKHTSLPAESGGSDMASASASVSLPARPVLSARRPSKNVCKVNIKEMEVENPEKVGAKSDDQIPEGSAGSTKTDFTIDIALLQFLPKMDSIKAVYPATGKKYHWVRNKASHRHRDLASGRIIKFKEEEAPGSLALTREKHPTLKSQGNSLRIVQISHWPKNWEYFLGQEILTDEIGRTLKKSLPLLSHKCFLKPEDFWIVAEDADD